LSLKLKDSILEVSETNLFYFKQKNKKKKERKKNLITLPALCVILNYDLLKCSTHSRKKKGKKKTNKQCTPALYAITFS
jgi:hypothetical protein